MIGTTNVYPLKAAPKLGESSLLGGGPAKNPVILFVAVAADEQEGVLCDVVSPHRLIGASNPSTVQFARRPVDGTAHSLSISQAC